MSRIIITRLQVKPKPNPKPKPKTEPKNPLFNHIVLEEVLSSDLLSFQDLKNIRLVCSVWHNVSLDAWRAKVVVTFSPSTKFRSGLTIADLEDRYDHKVGKLASKPYTMYKLKGWKPKFDPVESSVTPPQFAFGDKVAPLVEYLHIDQCNFAEAERYQDIVLQCDNVKELVVSGNTFMPKARSYEENTAPAEKKLEHLKSLTVDGVMTLDWYRFIMHTPHIENLTIKHNNTFSRLTFSEFLHEHAQVHRRHRVGWPLKHINLAEATGSSHFLKEFRSSDFPVESLVLQWENSTGADTTIVPILQGVAKSLKYLEIICISPPKPKTGPVPNWQIFPFPVQMEALTEIRFYGCVVDNLDFLRFTPVLKTLIMKRTNFENRHILIANSSTKTIKKKEISLETKGVFVDVVASTVECWNLLTKQPTMLMENLETLLVDCPLGVGSMYTLRRWLPNIKRFGQVFTDDTFRLACQEWPKLEELNVLFGSVVTDAAVTALHFLRLNSLKKFTMDAYCNEGWFSDKAVHDGFLKLKRLKCLRACVSRQMTAEAVRLLEGKIGCVNIIRNYGNGGHQDYECCQRLDFVNGRKILWDKDADKKLQAI